MHWHWQCFLINSNPKTISGVRIHTGSRSCFRFDNRGSSHAAKSIHRIIMLLLVIVLKTTRAETAMALCFVEQLSHAT